MCLFIPACIFDQQVPTVWESGHTHPHPREGQNTSQSGVFWAPTVSCKWLVRPAHNAFSWSRFSHIIPTSLSQPILRSDNATKGSLKTGNATVNGKLERIDLTPRAQWGGNLAIFCLGFCPAAAICTSRRDPAARGIVVSAHVKTLSKPSGICSQLYNYAFAEYPSVVACIFAW